MKCVVLGCLSALALGGAAFGQVVPTWELSRATDAITDEASVSAYLKNKELTASMFVTCRAKGQQLHVMFGSAKYLGGRGMRPITYRIDDGTPVQRSWFYSDKAALDQRDALTLASAVATGRKLVVRMTDYRMRSHDHVFDLPESSEPLAEVMRACAKD